MTRGRNKTRIWFLEKIGWSRVDLDVDMVRAAGHNAIGDPDADIEVLEEYSILSITFMNLDRGIRAMQIWCDKQCRKKWHYEPGLTFLFKSKKDAAIFKLTWWQ